MPHDTLADMNPDDPTTWPASARAYYQQRFSPTEATPLATLLVQQIQASGPLTFAQFMEAALYHPQHGYYLQQTSPLGRGADFVSAPIHHPAFGRLVGRRIRQIAAALGYPEDFTVVEMGAGTGDLAAGILDELSDSGEGEFTANYRIVEPFAVWRERQELRLQNYSSQLDWVADLTEAPPFTGVFISNELPDAFPVHRVFLRDGNLFEFWVMEEKGRLVEVAGPLSTPALGQYFDALALRPREDRPYEVCLQLRPWAQAVAARLIRGSFLTIDYGATAEELFGSGAARRGDGTLRAYRNQSVAPDPLAHPGRQDLTADVDFTTLIRAAEDSGLQLQAFTTQRQFLLAMGWREWQNSGESGGRKALLDLIDPRFMGNTRVLEMVRE